VCGALQEIWVRVLSEASSIRLLPFPLSIFFSSLFSLVACFVACIPVNTSRDPTAPGHHTPGSSKIPFPYHPPPLFLSAWQPVCLRASRVTVSHSSTPARQHRNTTRIGFAGLSILTKLSVLPQSFMMASQTSPTAAMHPHHVVQQGRGQPNGHVALQQPHQPKPASHFLQQANEGIWLQLGTFCVSQPHDASTNTS
jgi:hypothetical protein